MKTKSKRTTAIVTSLVMIMTILAPAGAFAAPPLQKPDYTFTESEANDGSFTDQITVDLGRTRVGILYHDHQYNKHEVTGQLPQGLSLSVTKNSSGDAVVKLAGKAVNHTSRSQHSVSISVKFYYTYNNNRNSGIVTKTFNIMFRDNEPEPQPTPAPTDEPGTGQVERLVRDKIRVLEIYPHDINNEKENVSNMDVVYRLGKDPRFEVTTMSINRLISLKDEINGRYDVVYFNGGNYTRNNVNEYSYGSDITLLCAGKLKEFIESGQLCIFHEDIFNKNSDPLGKETILKQQFSKYINDSAYRNVIVVTNNKNNNDKKKEYNENVINNLYNLYADTQKGMNPRPVLEIVEAPATYSAENMDPVSNRLTFRFKVYDPNSADDADLKVALYIDRNNDSLYNDKEIVYYQDDGDGVKYTLKVKNGRSGTITYDMPQGLTGVFFWKLVVIDAQDARNEFESVFRLKGDPITVRVLQIQPNTVVADNPNVKDDESDGNGNLSLEIKFKKQAEKYNHTYAERPGEYKIEVEEMTVKEFNEKASKGQIQLNGKYDMVILGFNDNYTNEKYMNSQNYSGALGTAAVNLLDDFIKTKQSVMFTHDTIHFTYNRDLTAKFGKAVGQVFETDKNGNFSGIWTAGLVSDSNLNGSSGVFTTDVLEAHRKTARDNIKKYDPKGHYQAINTYPNTATKVKPVNSSAITLYPFILEGGDYSSPDKMEVAATHFQWYKLDLEDPEVVPLYNLYVSGKDKINDDAMNNYYTYTKGTITYSGTGHKRDNSKRYPDFETKLFVNTAIKAYQIANHAPEVTILDPQDNSKVSRSDGDLELKFRAYDFDLGDDYLYYEVFIDTENRGRDEDFVSLTDGAKLRMSNGQQVSFTIPEEEMPGVGKFRLKVYAEDAHKAGSFAIITVEVVDSPLITPELVLCDEDGDPIEGALVNQGVMARMKFKVSGKTARETRVTPVFDLRGAYRTETEKDYLLGENLDEIVFSNRDPEPKEILRDYNFIVNPSEHGDTNLTMSVTVRKEEGLFDEKTGVGSIGVRNGHVEFYVRDGNGDPVKNAPIIDENTGAIIGMTDSSGYLRADGLVGVQNFRPGNVPGYTWKGDKTIFKFIKDEEGREKWVTAGQVDLTYENYRWKVEFTVEFSHGLSIEYYRLNMNRTAIARVGSAGEGAGGAVYEVKNHKLTSAVIVALVTVDPLVSGEVRKIDFKVETKRKSGGAETDVADATLKAVISDRNDTVIAGMVPAGCTQLKSSNELSEGSYAGKTYFLVIEVPKTDDQIVRISEVTLTSYTVNGTQNEKKITFSGGVKFEPTATPMLR